MDNWRLWHKFLEAIKSEIGGANLKTYFIKTLLKSVSGDVVTLNTPSAFIKENLDKKYKALIEATFAKILGKKVRFLRRDGIVYMPVPEGLTPKLE